MITLSNKIVYQHLWSEKLNKQLVNHEPWMMYGFVGECISFAQLWNDVLIMGISRQVGSVVVLVFELWILDVGGKTDPRWQVLKNYQNFLGIMLNKFKVSRLLVKEVVEWLIRENLLKFYKFQVYFSLVLGLDGSGYFKTLKNFFNVSSLRWWALKSFRGCESQ